MDKTEEFKQKLHYAMAFIGGFMGAYAILNRCDLFGNAQTANMIYIAMNILGRNAFDVIIRLGGMLIYMAGIAVTVIVPKKTDFSLQYIALALDGAVLIILGFLPHNINNVIALYPLFFAAAVQWNAFPGAFGYNSSTIFSTNNLRQFTMATTEYFCSRESKHAHKAKFYGGVLLFYHMGVAVSYISYRFLGIEGSWIGVIPVIVAAAMVVYKNVNIRVNKVSHANG